MSEALPKSHPVLLEPIHPVEIAIPSGGDIEGQRHRLRPAGADPRLRRRPGWDSWDVLKALLPESEIGDLIVELRSATSGRRDLQRTAWTISPNSAASRPKPSSSGAECAARHA